MPLAISLSHPFKRDQNIFFNNDEKLIVILKVSLVNTRYMKAACPNRILHEVASKTISCFEMQFVGNVFDMIAWFRFAVSFV